MCSTSSYTCALCVCVCVCELCVLGEDGALLAVSKYGGCVVEFLPGHLELMPNCVLQLDLSKTTNTRTTDLLLGRYSLHS